MTEENWKGRRCGVTPRCRWCPASPQGPGTRSLPESCREEAFGPARPAAPRSRVTVHGHRRVTELLSEWQLRNAPWQLSGPGWRLRGQNSLEMGVKSIQSLRAVSTMARSQRPQAETRGQKGLQRGPVPGTGRRHWAAGHFCSQSLSPTHVRRLSCRVTHRPNDSKDSFCHRPQRLEEELKLKQSPHSVQEINAFHCGTSDYL